MPSVPRQQILTIVNHAPIRAVLDYLLGEPLRKRSKGQVAELLGLEPPHFSKVYGGKLDAMTFVTYHRIRARLPKDQQRVFDSAFQFPDTEATGQRYQEWLTRALRRVLLGVGLRYGWDGQRISPVDFSGDRRSKRAQKKLQGGREGEFKALWGITDDKCGGILTDFYERHVNPKGKGEQSAATRQRRGHDDIRVELAIYRILAPLLESAASGFVEIHWRELSKDELKSFVLAGIAREDLLLKRAVDPQRIQEIASLDAKQFKGLFGLENMAPGQRFR